MQYYHLGFCIRLTSLQGAIDPDWICSSLTAQQDRHALLFFIITYIFLILTLRRILKSSL